MPTLLCKSKFFLVLNMDYSFQLISLLHQLESYVCESDKSLDRVNDLCDDQESCKVQASNRIFGDPCPGTYKYLEVKYQCFDGTSAARTKRSTAGEERKAKRKNKRREQRRKQRQEERRKQREIERQKQRENERRRKVARACEHSNLRYALIILNPMHMYLFLES